MPSVVSLRPLATGPAIQVNLAAMERPMREALRRAAVFLGYAVRSTEGVPLASVSLNAVIELDVGVGDRTGRHVVPPGRRPDSGVCLSAWSQRPPLAQPGSIPGLKR
jgi:hypothetical protein